MLAKIKKEIEADFAINEALLFDDKTSREEEEEKENEASELAQTDHLNLSSKVEDFDEGCDTTVASNRCF